MQHFINLSLLVFVCTFEWQKLELKIVGSNPAGAMWFTFETFWLNALSRVPTSIEWAPCSAASKNIFIGRLFVARLKKIQLPGSKKGLPDGLGIFKPKTHFWYILEGL
jgi:hypothetical protein